MASCFRRILLRKCTTSLRTQRLNGFVRRTFLSEAYRCDEAWKGRLNSPLLKDLDVENLAVKVQETFDRTGRVIPVDMDILASILERIDQDQLPFVQNLFHRFKTTADSLRMLESTGHAYIRTLYYFKEYEKLLEILKNKESYGVFLDNFSACILLDHFIGKEMYHEAAQVAFDQMLQEDFAHPIKRYLSWYACHKLLKNPPESQVEEEVAQQDEEEQSVLVDYIREMWYDDHWDIPTDSLRLGKTLTMVTDSEDTVLSRSYRLIGFALWEKYDKVMEMMTQWAKSSDKDIICQEALSDIQKLLEDLTTKETPEPKEAGTLTIADVVPYITAEQKEMYLDKFQSLSEKIQCKVTENFSLEEELEKRVKHVVQALEQTDIDDYRNLLSSWVEHRQNVVDDHVKFVEQTKRKREIADRLLELKKKEEKLSFFEQLGKISLGISRVREEKSLEDKEEEEVFVAAPTAGGRRR